MKPKQTTGLSLNQEDVSKHKVLKFFSAISMALPMFLSSMQSASKAYADGHHYEYLDVRPKGATVDQDGYGTRMYAWIGNYHIRHEAWRYDWGNGKSSRAYCLAYLKYSPSDGSKVQYTGQASPEVNHVLRVGFGANSLEEMGLSSGDGPEAEYATQIAVWCAMGRSHNNFNPEDIRWDTGKDATKAHQIFNKIWKEAKEVSGRSGGNTTLKLTKVDKSQQGVIKFTPSISENGNERAETGTITLNNATAEQENKEIKNGGKISANHQIILKVIDSGLPDKSSSGSAASSSSSESGSTSSGSTGSTSSQTITGKEFGATVKFPGYDLQTAEYTPIGTGTTQPGVTIIGVKDDKLVEKISNKTKEPTPDQPNPPTETDKLAMFDLEKVDDEGNKVNQAKFDIYSCEEGWSPDKFIGTITTNENGVARSGELPLGRYVAIESDTGKNLQVDKTPVEIDLTEGNLEDNAQVTKTKDSSSGKDVYLYHITVQGPTNIHRQPVIGSEATIEEDNTKDHHEIASPLTVNERVHAKYLVPVGQYEVTSQLIDRDSGAVIATATKNFVAPKDDPANNDGVETSVDMKLVIPNAADYPQHNFYVASTLKRIDGGTAYTVAHNDKEDTKEYIQTKSKVSFDIQKYDDENDRVLEATFDIYKADENWNKGEIDTLMTDKNGVAHSGELEPGRYLAIETHVGKNYKLDDIYSRNKK